ncbi:M23 family metallopeptidase [Leptolyngbya sp. FACHB-321]|uniref:M23 family metallopeptidase n=1 Tax=Leptolyngbya sp. FACHB-321 TaxID=2692807 RepID=UPI001F548FD9|nr:M23 family metallopeptidase [Leptolyngbya sp. FACHB-321]
MLDAIAQTLVEQTAKPVPPANVDTQAALVAPQQITVPVLNPTVSAPESMPPVSLTQAAPIASTKSVAVQRNSQPANTETATSRSTQPAYSSANKPLVNEAQADKVLVDKATQNVTTAQAAESDRSQLFKQATGDQRLVLKQKLADIVAKDKALKEAKLRANLEAEVIALAQARQFAQARQMAQNAMLSPETQADLLAQINAIAARRPFRSTIATKPRLPKVPLVRIKTKALEPTTSGRSLPQVVPYTSSPNTPQYSYIPPAPPNYVGYSLNGVGGKIGGIGVVVDNSVPDFNGQNWTATATGTRSNADLWNGLSFIFPLASPAPITSRFGWRVHPIRGNRRFHSGTDIGAPMGTPVLAAASGKVALSDQLGGYGLTVILSHQDNTRETLYAHLSALMVKPGQWVEKGDVIGRVGSTGLSTGPHLHFELRQKTARGWQAIDPGVPLKAALARLVKARQAG